MNSEIVRGIAWHVRRFG